MCMFHNNSILIRIRSDSNLISFIKIWGEQVYDHVARRATTAGFAQSERVDPFSVIGDTCAVWGGWTELLRINP